MIEQFHQILADSVKRQLISDVPISLFLSGGVDSSTIAYEAVKSGANIKTAYTISFSKDDNKYDGQSSDIAYASKMAKELDLDLQIIQASSDFISLLPDLIPFMEDGISDPAAINTYLICKSAREDGVKVMLSGQGADEYLCGYRRYRAEQIIEGLSPFMISAMKWMGKIMPSSIPGKLNMIVRRANKLISSAALGEDDRMVSYFNWCTKQVLQQLFVGSKTDDYVNPLETFYAQHKSKGTLPAMLLADQQFDLMSLNLAYTDKMSMRVGLEVRVPFLDLELVQFMNAIPIDMKMKNGELKYILKKAMEPYIPNEIIYRQKAGFALPIRAWLRKRNDLVNQYLNPVRLRSQEIYDVDFVEQLMRLHYSGKEDHSYLLFSMLCQQIWLDTALKPNQVTQQLITNTK